jgi:glycosyltransferase involved in cell wall biosynthesis
MATATVSCLVPACNAEPFLGQALESIFAQTHPPFEVIVVDDGSTDGTAAVARAAGATVIRQENRGYLAARDRALAHACGEYVAFLDADDYWAPGKTARQIAILQHDPTIDLCVTHYQNFWDDNAAHDAERYRDHPLARPLAGYIVPTLVARRSAFDRFGTFSSGGNSSDTAWFARAVSLGARIETLADVLLHRRLHGGNLSIKTGSSVSGLFDLIRRRRRQT